MDTKQQPLESIQAARFDECVAELSPEAQRFFAFAVREISNGLSKGGGVVSAKAFLYVIARLDKPLYTKG
jgi:hypothetical protein